MLKRFMFLLVLLLQIGELQAGNRYYYGLLVDGVPYIFNDGEKYVTQVKEGLLKGLLTNDFQPYVPHLSSSPDSSIVLFSSKSNYRDAINNYKLWRLSGRERVIQNLSGFPKQQRYWIQIIDSSSSRFVHEVKIRDIFYDLNGSVVARCEPINVKIKSRGPLNHVPNVSFVATSNRYAHAPLRSEFENHPLPKQHQDILNNMPNTEISDSAKAGNFYNGPMLSYQRLLIKDRSKIQPDTLYALMCSYYIANHVRAGTIIILDSEGAEIYRSKKSDYYYIQGVSDVDGNGTHELILRNGSEWGGIRYELLVPKLNQERKWAFETKFKKQPPHAGPTDCGC